MSHEALLYPGADEVLEAVQRFIAAGAAAGEPALVLLPQTNLERVRALDPSAELVRFEDASEVGRNPARILPLLHEWVDRHSGPARAVVELLWPGRDDAEASEVARHEALLNAALADAPLTVLCAYDAGGIDPDKLAFVDQSHPRLRRADGESRQSSAYSPPDATQLDAARELAAPDTSVDEIPVEQDLWRLRAEVAGSHAAAPLPAARRKEFVLAVNEVAANALEYAEPPRGLRLWREDARVVAEVAARGRIDDPFAGMRRPDPMDVRGRGLWIVNQLCDLVQLCNDGATTRVRMHMRCS